MFFCAGMFDGYIFALVLFRQIDVGFISFDPKSDLRLTMEFNTIDDKRFFSILKHAF